MNSIFNIINFGNILALTSVISLPILFFILKFYPPSPKRANFSSLFLLKDIVVKNTAKSKYPIWLLIYRLLICLLVILFFSKPYITKDSDIENYKNYVIIADNGWSIANNWENYKNIIKQISLQAESKNKSLHLYFSSPEHPDDPYIFQTKNETLDFLKDSPPLARQISRKKVINILKENNYFKSSKAFFIFSSFDTRDIITETEILDSIQKNNPSIQIINPIKKITFIENVDIEKETLKLNIKRKGSYEDNSFFLEVSGYNGEVFFKKEFFFEEEKSDYFIEETFPTELINQFFKIKILKENHAGAVYYLDDLKKGVTIGIVSNDNSIIEKPLLSPIYYIKKALGPSHVPYLNTLNKIIEENPSVIFFASNKKISNFDKKRLKNWISQGGVLIRFADKNIVKQKELYFDGKSYYKSIRNIGADLSIQNKPLINAFKENSLFSTIKPPKDIDFKKQLILDNFDNNIKVLASLNDLSPLISMKYLGKGKVVVFHVTSNNEWSNLPLSNVFRELLSKLLLLSKIKKDISNEKVMIKYKVNAFGELISPLKNYTYISDNLEKTIYPSEDRPAGVYESDNLSIAINLSGNLIKDSFFSGYKDRPYIKNEYEDSVFELKGILLFLIFSLFFIDMLLNIFIKKPNISYSLIKKNSFIAIFLLILINVNDLMAEDSYNNLYLAYVNTENQFLNDIASSGLNNLKNYLNERTSIMPKGVKEININEDEIFYYPLIYWQLSKKFPELNKDVIQKIKDYFNSGGIILFDIIDFSKSYTSINRENIEIIKDFFLKLGIQDLQKISKDHTLTKSYYLLNRFPGRWDNRLLLVDQDYNENNDGVSSVIVGLNDWVSAWAIDKNNYPLFQVVPGGDRQRELSYRFGINVIVYSLTGNYKSDQVHSKSILKRLKKDN